jgi:hypothetical protein
MPMPMRCRACARRHWHIEANAENSMQSEPPEGVPGQKTPWVHLADGLSPNPRHRAAVPEQPILVFESARAIAVSRQSIFAGEPPFFFGQSLNTTRKEERLWTRCRAHRLASTLGARRDQREPQEEAWALGFVGEGRRSGSRLSPRRKS